MLRYVYSVGIIDDFTGFELFENVDTPDESYGYYQILDDARTLLIKYTNWEGDGRFLILPILNDEDIMNSHLALVIKQSNNGSTFVVSPIKIDGLESKLSGEIDFEEINSAMF